MIEDSFTPERIEDLLKELGTRLTSKGIRAEFFVVGGAAMALAYGSTRLTKDIDAVFRPRDEVIAEAVLMAREYGLSDGWINDAVVHVMPAHPDKHPRTVFESVGAKITLASPEYVLGMKIMAARNRSDREDAKILCRLLGITDYNKAIDLAEDIWGPNLGVPSELFIEDAIDEILDEDRAAAQATQVLPIPARVPGPTPAGMCGKPMPRAGRACVLRPHHYGGCRSTLP